VTMTTSTKTRALLALGGADVPHSETAGPIREPASRNPGRCRPSDLARPMTPAITLEDSGTSSEPRGAAHSDADLAATMAGTSGAEPELPRVLTPDELAKVLRVRRRSVYEAISRGDIPGVRRIGRKVRIDRDSVLAWMADGHGRAPRSSRR
jgi:excisionase family DNA binding protein